MKSTKERECKKDDKQDKKKTKNKEKEAKIYTRAINLYEEQWTRPGRG